MKYNIIISISSRTRHKIIIVLSIYQPIVNYECFQFKFRRVIKIKKIPLFCSLLWTVAEKKIWAMILWRLPPPHPSLSVPQITSQRASAQGRADEGFAEILARESVRAPLSPPPPPDTVILARSLGENCIIWAGHKERGGWERGCMACSNRGRGGGVEGGMLISGW